MVLAIRDDEDALGGAQPAFGLSMKPYPKGTTLSPLRSAVAPLERPGKVDVRLFDPVAAHHVAQRDHRRADVPGLPVEPHNAFEPRLHATGAGSVARLRERIPRLAFARYEPFRQ